MNQKKHFRQFGHIFRSQSGHIFRSQSGNYFIEDGSGGGGGSDLTAAQVPATISDVKLVNAFFRGRRTPEQQDDGGSPCDGATPVRNSKDSVNMFLKNAASRLTSIEEAAVEGYSTASSGSSGSSGQATNEGKSSSDSATLTSGQRQQQQKQLSTPSKYPNIDFLENDVSLWDAFFLRGKTSGRFKSVLRPTAPPPPAPPPPLPVEEYLQCRPKSSRRRIPIHDADSLRTLLPQAHKHLLTPSTATSSVASPASVASQSMSKLNLRSGDDKSCDSDKGAKQKWSPAGVVREAWPSVDESSSPVPPFVVRRRRPSRRSSSANSSEQRNLNALNNNDENNVDDDNNEDEDDCDDVIAKRRSFHPQDFLSKLLTRSSHQGRKSDFPKVIFLFPRFS